jgi:hypothetical protein
MGTQNISVLHDSSTTGSFNYLVTCGNHNFTATIDSANTIAETNETNNSATISNQFCPAQVQYTLSAISVPARISLGNSVQIRATPSPLNIAAAVNTVWNNQNLVMAYNSAITAYSVNITPIQTGIYLVPVTFRDSNNVQITVFVPFTVLDSLPDVSVNKIAPISYPVIANNNTTFNVEVSNNGFQSLLNDTVHFSIDGIILDSFAISSLLLIP